MRRPRGRLVLGNAEHRVGRLVVLGQPREHGGRRIGRDEHVVVLEGHPLPDVRPEALGGMGRRSRPGCCSGGGLGGAARSGEAEPAQDAPGLMGGEVGAVETGRQGDHLLRRVASPVDDDVVVADWLGERPRHGAHDSTRIEVELLSTDLHRARSHAISSLYSLIRL